ncbi:uncharacterized protein LOC121731187 [Aricia agestis]|uniref:uncharacterized protein LOC121731187 n=1 Tax=Aricia agestis TaxID=91739 RepID=UPI001C2047AF|nr:uncharacterized protein LOC121731187 [Aricia agestis]
MLLPKTMNRRRSESSVPSSAEGRRDYKHSSDDNRRDEDIDAREAESRCGTPHHLADVEDVDYMESPAPAPASPQAAPPTTAPLSQPEATVPVDTNQESTPTLPLEILNVLGEANKREKALGECIPTELSERWGKILVDGLAKEYKESLVAKILIPNNFSLAQAPKLNQVVAAVLQEAKQISETAQILLDLHYEESVNRKKLILPSLDKKFWNTIQGVKRDVYLFGESSRKQQAPPGNSRAPPRQQYARPAPVAPAHLHEPQPSTSARRAQQPPRRGRHYASARPGNDRRRRY